MSAWSKLPRSILGVLGVEGWQTAGLNALNNNRGQWPDGLTAGKQREWHECLVEAAADHFRGFRGLGASKRQA